MNPLANMTNEELELEVNKLIYLMGKGHYRGERFMELTMEQAKREVQMEEL
jgi:hypothetical protein